MGVPTKPIMVRPKIESSVAKNLYWGQERILRKNAEVDLSYRVFN